MINTGVLKGNPFPGIRPFTSAEEKLYFGRDEDLSEVLDLLKTNRFVALAGASASGKSSLIHSGLIPALLADERQEWVPVVMRPGQNPVENLVREFQKVFPNKLRESDVASFLKGSMDLSQLIVEKGLGSHHYFLVVDQFEELFLTDPMGKPRVPEMLSRRFLDLLVRALKAEKPEVYVVLSMRSDYLEISSTHRQLAELMNKSKYLLPPMSVKAISESISGPLQQAGVRLEAGFKEYILDDLEGLELPLPRLQFALMRSWETWLEGRDRDRPLTINDYQSVGSVETALGSHLDTAYSSLDESQKYICERLFKTLSSKSARSGGYTKQASLGNIARIAHCSQEDLIDVVEVFRREGRGVLFPATGNLNSETSLEISHESLIRIWDRLGRWVEEEDESVKMYLRLSEASALYQQGRTELWSGADLQTAIQWRESQKPTPAWGVQYDPAFERAMVFLSTSEEELAWEEERKVIQQRRRLLLNRSIAIFMAVLVLVLGSVFVISRYMPDSIQKPDVNGTDESSLAEVVQPVEEQLVEEPAYQPATRQTSGQEEAQEPVYQVSESEVSEQELGETPVQSQPSRGQDTQERVTERTPPVQTESTAPSIMPSSSAALALAGELARKSQRIERNTDLQGLLAYQAYLFNSEYGGNEYDLDIYMGLYSSLKKLISPAYNIYPNIRSSVKDMAWLRRTGSVLTVSSDGSVKILSGAYASRASQINLPGTGYSNECVALSPDEKKAVVGTNGAGLVVLELEDRGKVIHEDARNGKAIIFLQTLGNSGSFISAGPDNRIFKWSFEDYSSEVMLTTASRISALSATSNGSSIAYATRDGKLYELPGDGSAKARLVAELGKNHARALSFSPGGQKLAVGLLDGTIRIFTGIGRSRTINLSGAEAGITDLEYSSDGRFLAASSRDGNVYLWSTSNLQSPPAVFDENNGFVLSLCFSRSGEYFYSGSVDFPRFISRPVETATMVGDFCSLLGRNLTPEEWEQYVGSEIPYQKSCPDKN